MTQNLQNILTKEMLEYEYKACGSMQKVADKLKVSVDSVYKYMKLYQIQYHNHYIGIYTCDTAFFTHDTSESFYIAGFIAADGSLQHRQYSKILKICLADKDASHLEKIKKELNSTHPLKTYIVKPSKLTKRISKCVEIQIANNELYDSLGKFNIIPNKTFTYNMPDWLIKHQLVNHFMRGYFDGDGCISISKLRGSRHFNILGTKKFLEQYRTILEANCNLNHNKILAKDNVFSLSYGGNNASYELYSFLYQDATIYLDRKENKFYNPLKTYLPLQ